MSQQRQNFYILSPKGVWTSQVLASLISSLDINNIWSCIMPIRRRTFRRRRVFKRRTFRSRKAIVPTVKRTLYRMGIQPPLTKYNDYTDFFSLGTPNITPANTGSPWNTQYTVYLQQAVRISAGDQVDDRSSNIIKLRRLGLRINLQNSLAATENTVQPYSVRCMLIMDRQTVSDASSISALSSVLQQGASTNDWAAMTSFLNVTATRGRYKVLWDQTYRFAGSGNYELFSGSGATAMQFGLKDINIKKNIQFGRSGLAITYNGDNPTDIQKNGIYFVMFTDNQQAATSPTNVSIAARAYYVENL